MSLFHATLEHPTLYIAGEAEAEALATALLSTVTDNVYLVLLTVYQGPDEAETITPTPTLAFPTLSLPPGEEGSSGEATLYYSDRGYESAAADDPAYTIFEGRALNPLTVDRDLPVGPRDDWRVASQLGQLEFANADGGLDSASCNVCSAADGRRVRVLVGRPSDALTRFTTIFDGSGASVAWSRDRARARLAVRDNAVLAEVVLQQDHYEGTGGAEGTSDVANRPRPFLLGQNANVTPILVDPSFNVYQAHARSMEAVDAAYDGGVALTFHADYASYAALIAATIPAGRYATCLAEGLIRTETTPSFQLTVDVRGDNTGGYVDTVGGMMLRALQYAGVDAAKLDIGAFTTLAAAVSYTAGIYLPDEVTAAQVCNELARSIGAWWGDSGVVLSGIGKIGCGRLTAPDAVPDWYLDTASVLSLEPLAPFDEISPPPLRVTVGWRRNWTVQAGSALAGSVTQARRQFLAEEFRRVAVLSTDVEARHLLSSDWPLIPTCLYDEADAQAEAQRLSDLYSVDRNAYVAKLNVYGHNISLGQTVRLVWPRYGLDNGKNFRVIGKRDDCDRRRVFLKLWG